MNSFVCEVLNSLKLKLRRKIRSEISLDNLQFSKPEALILARRLASESMAGEIEEQTKTLQPHLSKQDVKTLVCTHKSIVVHFHNYLLGCSKYIF